MTLEEAASQLADLRLRLFEAGMELGIAMREIETEIASEKLAGNKVKEDLAKAHRAGLMIAINIQRKHLSDVP